MTSDLSKQQREELLPTREILRLRVALVLIFELLEFVSRKNPEQLSINRYNLFHSLELIVNRAYTKGYVTFKIAVSRESFKPFNNFLPDTTDSYVELLYTISHQMRRS